MERDLTTGSVLKNTVYFSLPYLLSYFLQTLYGMADLFIIGQFCEVADVTAVSIGSQVMHMLTVMIVGLAMGTTVTVSRNIGGGNRREATAAIGNTVVMFAVIAAVMTAILSVAVEPIVNLMSTPAEAFGGTRDYLIICFAGIPFITAYNIISSILRGMGDSKSPMMFIAVACAANILLDLLFIGVFDMGSAGAALGTTAAQAISVVFGICVIVKRKMIVGLSRADFKPNKNIMSGIFKIGMPVALQDGFIQISFIAITIMANMRGLVDSAAVGIVEKIISILFLVPSSMLSSVSAIAAQNFGANKPECARLTLRYAMCFSVGFGIIVGVLMQLCAQQAVGIFESDAAVMAAGAQYLKSYVFDCAIAGVHFCFSGYFCAMERSGISFLHNVLSIVLARIPLAYLASVTFADTLYPMGLAAPIGSLISAVVCIVAYVIIQKKDNR